MLEHAGYMDGFHISKITSHTGQIILREDCACFTIRGQAVY